jgi:hypothetical protein
MLNSKVMKEVFYSLRRRLGRDLEMCPFEDDTLVCGIRYWGNWEHDYTNDYEDSDYEDDDNMILSDESMDRLYQIVGQVRSEHKGFQIFFDVSEKNTIHFEVKKR